MNRDESLTWKRTKRTPGMLESANLDCVVTIPLANVTDSLLRSKFVDFHLLRQNSSQAIADDVRTHIVGTSIKNRTLEPLACARVKV